jgi:hypothetical protein
VASADPADLERLRAVLERARSRRTTLTYLQVADALDVRPPQRIHQTVRLIERLLKMDVDADRAPLAALAVSRARGGLPAPGFFERAERLGIYSGTDPEGFHERLLTRLFDRNDSES